MTWIDYPLDVLRSTGQWLALGLTISLIAHSCEYGAACQRLILQSRRGDLNLRARAWAWSGRLTGRLISIGMLTVLLILVAAALTPSQASVSAVLVFALAGSCATLAAMGWGRWCHRNLTTWGSRCEDPRAFGILGPNAQVVGWRVARHSSRLAGLLLGVSLILVPTVGYLVNGVVDGQIGDAVTFIVLATVWAVLVVGADGLLSCIDPLARLVFSYWHRFEDPSRIALRGSTPMDLVMYPLRMRPDRRQDLRAAQLRLAWVAAVGLNQVARTYPPGTATGPAQARLLAAFTKPDADVRCELLRIIEAIATAQLPGVTAHDDPASYRPPVFAYARRIAWAVGGLSVCLGTVVTIVRAFRQIGW
jgi:hypothetical protein